MKLGSWVKQPQEREVFEISLQEALEVGDRLTNAVLSVSPAGLVIDDYTVLNDAVKIWVLSGVAATDYRITALITTLAGRSLEDFVIIKVRQF